MARLAGVVLQRELIRLARRRQTWILRTAYTGLLLSFCLYVLSTQIWVASDPQGVSRLGTQLFWAYHTLQMGAVALLAPLLVAAGVQEEKQARTLDLMALTGVRPGAILYDQVASRLFALMAVILAGVPFLALLITFGGFGPMQVVNGVYAAFALAVILGNFAGHAALLTRGGPLPPLLLCIPYSLFFFGVPLSTAAPLVQREPLLALTPLFAMGTGEPSNIFISALVWVPAVVIGWGLTVPVFQIQAGGGEDDDEFGMLSPEFWAVERFKRNTWLWLLVTCAIWAGLLLLVCLGFWGARPGYAPLAWIAASISAVLVHRVALISVLVATQYFRRMSLPGAELFRRRETAPRGVWNAPIAWRETVTRSAGASRLVPLGMAGLWFFLLGSTALFEGVDSVDAKIFFTILAAFGAWLTAALVATATLLDERRQGNLGLLLLTRLGPWEVVRQKTVAPVLLSAPLVGAGIAFWAQRPAPREYYMHSASSHVHLGGGNWLSAVPILPELAWAVWILLVAANVGLVASLAAAWVGNVRTGWISGLAAGTTWVFWPLALALTAAFLRLSDLNRPLETALAIWYPIFDYQAAICGDGGVPGFLAAAIAVQFALTPVLWRLLAGQLRRLAAE